MGGCTDDGAAAASCSSVLGRDSSRCPKRGFASEPPDLDAAENLILCWFEAYRLQEGLQCKAWASEEAHVLPADVNEDSPLPPLQFARNTYMMVPLGSPGFWSPSTSMRHPGGYKPQVEDTVMTILRWPVRARTQSFYHESSGNRIPDFNQHGLGFESYLSYSWPWCPWSRGRVYLIN